jgi:DNA repair exonuclease SbcCD ATPase subunit
MKTYPYLSPDGAGSSGDPLVDPQGSVTPTPSATDLTPTPTANNGGEDWEKKFKGLQPVIQKFSDSNKKLDEDLKLEKDQHNELKTKYAILEDQMRKLQEEFDSSKESVENSSKSLTAKDLEIQRLKLLINEFPELARFERSDVLPKANSVEELKTKYQGFKDAMGDLTKVNAQQMFNNSAPPSGGGGSNGGTALTIEQLQDQLNSLAGIPDKRAEYLKLRDQFDALLEAQGK